tara:strand:+ start:891 stop:1292 length:402 start_codon:yes stop_codon:yes gene_type:complete
MNNKLFSLSVFLLVILTPLSLRANVEESQINSNIEIFEAWWEKKDKNCTITFTNSTSTKPATLQVDNGIPIFKENILEIYRQVENKGAFRPKRFIYNMVYKDENSKVSTSKIIFVNQASSYRFQKALEKFGLN